MLLPFTNSSQPEREQETWTPGPNRVSLASQAPQMGTCFSLLPSQDTLAMGGFGDREAKETSPKGLHLQSNNDVGWCEGEKGICSQIKSSGWTRRAPWLTLQAWYKPLLKNRSPCPTHPVDFQMGLLGCQLCSEQPPRI